MRKVLFFLCIFFIALVSAACTGAIINEDKPNPKVNEGPVNNGTGTFQYIPRPEITVDAIHKYAEWDKVDVKESSIKIAAQYFGLNIIFNRTIKAGDVQKLITVKGCSIYQFDFINSSTIHILCTEGIPGRTYTLVISKGIEDLIGHSLKEDIKVDVTVCEDPVAHYTLLGSDEVYNMEPFMQGYPAYLTPYKKIFVMDFTKEMDRKSVEDSISGDSSLKDTACSFKWLDNKRLELTLQELKADQEYSINVLAARDVEGFKALGNLNFQTSEPNSIGCIDIFTKQDTVIKEIQDRLFMPYGSTNIGSCILFDDTYKRYMLDISSRKVKSIPLSANYRPYIGWLEDKSLLYYNPDDKSLYIYSVADGSVKVICSLSFLPENKMVRMISISPDKKKAAIISCINEYGLGGPADVYILSTGGQLLSTFKNIANMRSFMPGYDILDMSWKDNSTLMIESASGTLDINSYDILEINVETGKKKIYVENAIRPLTLPEKDLMLVQKWTGNESIGYKIIFKGNESGTIPFKTSKHPEGSTLGNFYFLDENRLVFNRDDDIVLYDINKKTEDILGRGIIIGISDDRSRLYYMSNCIWFYEY